MKITKQHREYMATKIGDLLQRVSIKSGLSVQGVVAHHTDTILKGGRFTVLDKRVRWDLFACAGLSRWACDNMYPYADDTHIDTALRAIMRDIEGSES